MDQKFTLAQLTDNIKNALAEAFPASVWVVGEISELKENRGGHCYLELIEKEGNEITARARATIWSYTYRMLKPYFETTTGQNFTQGIKILVQVSVEFHPAFGLSLNIKDIDPVYTVGDMAMQQKEILDRLRAEGVLNMNKELVLPLVPQKIAVISSETAAGYQDFINQLQNNDFGFKFHTKLFQSTMQGKDTVPSVIHSLEKIFQYEDFFDAVVIIRGGGATADLSSFNNYELAYHITQFPLPVITGIGHEKDDTIIDLVAHTRLKTPTAVAEFFITGMERFYDRLLDAENEIVNLTRAIVDNQQKRLERLANEFDNTVSEFLDEKNRQLAKKGNELLQKVNRFAFNRKHELNSLKHDLDRAVSVRMVKSENTIQQKEKILQSATIHFFSLKNGELVQFKKRLLSEFKQFLTIESAKIKRNENSIRLLDPENILKRGYSLTLKDGKFVKSVKQLQVADELETRLADGKVLSKITKTEIDDN